MLAHPCYEPTGAVSETMVNWSDIATLLFHLVFLQGVLQWLHHPLLKYDILEHP